MEAADPLAGSVLYEELDGTIGRVPVDRFLSRATPARLADGRTVRIATALVEGKTARELLGECEVCFRLFPKAPSDPLNRYLFGDGTGAESQYRDDEAERCAEHGGAPRAG